MEQYGGTVKQCGRTVKWDGGRLEQYGRTVEHCGGTVWNGMAEQCGTVWWNSGRVWWNSGTVWKSVVEQSNSGTV